MEALSDWQFSIDDVELEVTDTIGELKAPLVFYDRNNNENLFCDNFRRNPGSYIGAPEPDRVIAKIAAKACWTRGSVISSATTHMRG